MYYNYCNIDYIKFNYEYLNFFNKFYTKIANSIDFADIRDLSDFIDNRC